jgi:hypothetical protein
LTLSFKSLDGLDIFNLLLKNWMKYSKDHLYMWSISDNSAITKYKTELLFAISL